MYQLTTSGFPKLLVFNPLGSLLGYIVENGMVYLIFTILLLGKMFPTISCISQIDILCKSYAPRKLAYKFPTLWFTKLLSFHLIGSRLC
jgi:hypothetical protein